MKYLLSILLFATLVYADMQLAPDGSYINGTPQLTPNGHYVGSGNIQMNPNGNYMIIHPEPKQTQQTYQLKDYTNEYNTKINSKQY